MYVLVIIERSISAKYSVKRLVVLFRLHVYTSQVHFFELRKPILRKAKINNCLVSV